MFLKSTLCDFYKSRPLLCFWVRNGLGDCRWLSKTKDDTNLNCRPFGVLICKSSVWDPTNEKCLCYIGGKKYAPDFCSSPKAYTVYGLLIIE